jgi:hypothetical protein
MVTIYLFTAIIFLTGFFYLGFKYPSSSELYEHEAKRTKAGYKTGNKRLKVVNKYFNGLFKKVVILDNGKNIIKFYCNNYFKGKYFLIKTINKNGTS